MKFDSLADFVQMDGHGLYIWLAYGITLIVLSANLWWPRVTRQRFIRTERNYLARQDKREPS